MGRHKTCDLLVERPTLNAGINHYKAKVALAPSDLISTRRIVWFQEKLVHWMFRTVCSGHRR